MIVKCKYCDKELGESSFGLYMQYFKAVDEKGNRRLFCSEEHFEEYKNNFLVETYKNKPIYKIENEKGNWYLPYWSCDYAFKALEDCKLRLDKGNIAIINNICKS
jgi:hypothetical protein